MSLLSVLGLAKGFHGRGPLAVDGVSFDLEPDSITAILGPSGCGKTTTLRLVAGFERPDEGTISLEGRALFGPGADLPPERRGVGFVFQDYALFPHLSVLENVRFGLGGLPRAERRGRALEVLNLVGLTVFKDRLPHQLSGGQQQRVALARALAPRPRLVLLDEPFSSLDAGLRASTRLEVRRILEGIGATALLVTHDQEEAMSFADRLIVMRAGRVEQDGPPERVYRAPRTAFVAGFLGRTNLIAARVRAGRAHTALGALDLGPSDPPPDGPAMLSVRPEDLRLEPLAPSSDLSGSSGVVVAREFKGRDATLTLETSPNAGGLQIVVQAQADSPLRVGDRARVLLAGRAVVVGPSDGSG